MRPPEHELIYDWNTAKNPPRPSRPVEFDDETLRDGLQGPSVVSPSIEDKIRLLHSMDRLGLHTADIGLPGAGPHVVAHVRRLAPEIASAPPKVNANCAARAHQAGTRPVGLCPQ